MRLRMRASLTLSSSASVAGLAVDHAAAGRCLVGGVLLDLGD